MNQEDDVNSIKLLKALADDIRLGVAKHIAAQPGLVPSCDVVQSCAQRLELSQPSMSHHFKKLVSAGVITVEKKGTENFYRLNHAVLEQHGIDISKL